MWETSVRYFQKSIRIIRPIRGRKKEYEHQWFNLTTDIADLADKILTKENHYELIEPLRVSDAADE